MCRHGTNSQGSENLFLNCHFNNPGSFNPTTGKKGGIAFRNYTYNALQQTFIGGNFSQHITGIMLNAGTANLFSVGFQAKKPDQIDYNGYDLQQTNTANSHISMTNCRSESLKMVSAYNGATVVLDNMCFDSTAPNGVWLPNHAYIQGQITQGITNGKGNGHLHVCWQAGITGTTEPVYN